MWVGVGEWKVSFRERRKACRHGHQGTCVTTADEDGEWPRTKVRKVGLWQQSESVCFWMVRLESSTLTDKYLLLLTHCFGGPWSLSLPHQLPHLTKLHFLSRAGCQETGQHNDLAAAVCGMF